MDKEDHIQIIKKSLKLFGTFFLTINILIKKREFFQ